MEWVKRKLPDVDLTIAPAGDPVIASVFVDDAMPGINPMRLHQPHYGHEPAIPNAVLLEFAETMEREGMAGKFSVVPYPLGIGRIDQSLEGVPDAEVREFVALVRDRLMPRFDITPEVLTHGPAIDPVTGYRTHLTEKEWGSAASALEWRNYVRNAFALLANVGIDAAGCTSPWDTAADNEDAYALGILAAAADIGLDVPFYFLHMAERPEQGMPEVRVFRRGGDGVPARAVVSLKCSANDPLWPTQYGRAPRTDALIGEGGEGGVLAAFGDAGAPIVVVTHWQSLYGNGARRVPAVFGDIGQRLRSRYGARLAWWSGSRMARFAAGAHGARVARAGDHLELDLPLPLEGATITLTPAPGHLLAPMEGAAPAARPGPGGCLVLEGDFAAGRLIAARFAGAGAVA
jgi:hypothetical protein